MQDGHCAFKEQKGNKGDFNYNDTRRSWLPNMTIKDNSNDQGAMNGKGGPKDTPISPAFLAIPLTDDRRRLSSDAVSDVPSDVIIKSRIHNGSRWAACKGLLMEYSKSTSIHGIRYLFEVHRPIYEKIFWLVTLSTSLYFAVTLSRDMYRKWQDSPVILAFDDTLVPVHQIPFPTITICPQTKIRKSNYDFEAFAKRLEKQYDFVDDAPEPDYKSEYESEEGSATYEKTYAKEYEKALWRLMAASLHICDNEFALKYAPLLKHAEDPQKTRDNLFSISETFFYDLDSETQFNGYEYFTYQIFNLVATDEGICFQFNGLAQEDIYRNDSFPTMVDRVIDQRYRTSHREHFTKKKEHLYLFELHTITGNWSLEDGYVGQGFYAYPQRTAFATVHKGFIGALDMLDQNRNTFCSSNKIGYKMFLNSPESIPQTSGNYIQLSPGQEVIISLIPQYVRSTADVRAHEPRKRQCYFNDERYLRLFRQYTQSNCQTECLVNFTIAKCGCAQYWMPKPEGVPGCGVMDIGCYKTAQTELNLILQNQTLQAQRNRSAEIMCDCMPACTTLDYNFEISRARYDKPKLMGARRFTYVYNVSTNFKVFFKERQFMAIKRTVLFSVTTLIANHGAICGLVMGISGLSLIELVYFVSLRLYNSLHLRRVSKKKLDRKLKKKLLMQQILVTASPSFE